MPFRSLRGRGAARSLLAGLALFCLAPVSAAHAQQPAALRGDVDGDGRVTAADAQAVRDQVAGRPARPGTVMLPNGDVNGDGRITAVDAAMIQAFAAGRDLSRFGLGQPIQGSGAGGGRLTVAFECTVDTQAGTQSCQAPRAAAGAQADLILGATYIKVAFAGTAVSKGDPATEDTTTSNASLTNLIGQPIGTTDGTTAHPDGNRVFFHSGPTVTSVTSGTLASATVRMDNAAIGSFSSADGAYSATDRPYYQYNGVLAKNAVSPSQMWRFVYSSNTRSFTYRLYVSAPVQYEYGWITLSPATPVIEVGATTGLTPTVYEATGATLTDGLTWSSSNTAVATVDAATGVVTGVAAGTATITATSTVKAQRTGAATVTVMKGSAWLGTVGTGWSDPANWLAGSVPDSTDDANIPASAPYMPVLSANALILNLEAAAGSTVDLGSFTLQLKGNANASGTVSNGTLWLRGAGALLQGNVPSVVITGGTSLQGATKATGALSVSGGSLRVADQALSISVP